MCGTIHAHLPMATCANVESTEFVSTWGVRVMVWSAAAASTTCLSRMSHVSDAGGLGPRIPSGSR